MALTLWGGGTPRSLRAHWALAELDLPYEARLIGPRTGATQEPAFVALNVKEKIPVLQDDELTLTESGAIVSYLGSRYGAGSGLVPTAAKERARYDEWLCYVLMELDAHTLYVLRKHRDLTTLYGEAPAAVDAAIAGFYKQLRFAQAHFANADTILASGFSGADIIFATTLDWAVAYGFELPASLESYRLAQRERPARRRASRANRLPQ